MLQQVTKSFIAENYKIISNIRTGWTDLSKKRYKLLNVILQRHIISQDNQSKFHGPSPLALKGQNMTAQGIALGILKT